MIIDSHIHISRSKNDVQKTLKSMKKHGISYSIAIPDNVSTNPLCADIKTLIHFTDNEKYLFSMGTINIFENIEKQILNLEKLIKTKKICAIKLFPGHDPFYPTDLRCQSVYKLCIKYDIPIVFHTGINTGNTKCAKYNDPKYIVKIINRYQNLKIVIAHYFWPKMEYCYRLTKNIKNIYYDTSAMADPEVIKSTGGWNKVAEILKKTISLKPDKVLFGTDWPMCPIDKHIQLIKDLKLTSEIEKMVFSLNAIKLYKLKISQINYGK